MSGPSAELFYESMGKEHPEMREARQRHWVQVPFLLFTNFVIPGKLFNLF